MVLVTALLGLNVVLVLLLGTIVAGVIGFATGSLTLATYSAGITDGISGMASIIIVTIILRGLKMCIRDSSIDWSFFAVLAAPLIFCATHSRIKVNKWFFYAFYPAHLAVIALVQNCLLYTSRGTGGSGCWR